MKLLPGEAEETRFGFRWGPVVIERVAVMPSGHHVLYVNGLEIYVSPAGRKVRVFKGREELK